MILRYFGLCILFLLLGGCLEDATMEKPREIVITIGEAFEEFVNRYPNVKIKKSPAGLNFYNLDWPLTQASKLIINKHTTIQEVIHLSIMEDTEMSNKGISLFSFQAGLTTAELINHNKARLKFYEILRGLLDQGWQRAIAYDEPRLTAAQAMYYKLIENRDYQTDPGYVATLKEWNRLHRHGASSPNYWELHFDNKLFMHIQLAIQADKADPEMGAYLMFIEVVNGENQAKKYFAPENKLTWKENWAARLKKAAVKRAEKERVLTSKGYKIDENYVDYVINPEDY